ncbi:hypothetical protein D9M70_474260 [compost metagenome]
MLEAELRKQLGLERRGEIAAHRQARGMAEEADARVGVATLLAWFGARFPVAEVSQHVSVALDLVGELQRQAAGGIGGEIEQGRLVDRAAAEIWHVFAGMVVEGQLAEHLRIGCERAGKGLADRAQLEQCVFGDGRLRFLGGDAVVDEVVLAVNGDRDRHARHLVFAHDRSDCLVHGCGNSGLLAVGGKDGRGE